MIGEINQYSILQQNSKMADKMAAESEISDYFHN